MKLTSPRKWSRDTAAIVPNLELSEKNTKQGHTKTFNRLSRIVRTYTSYYN